MKRRIILIIILVISMLMLSSCTALYKGLGRLVGEGLTILYYKTTGGDDTTKITNKLEELLMAIENQDSVTVSSIFSENAKEQAKAFDASVEELIGYYSGSRQAIELPGAGACSSHSRDSKTGEQKILYCSFDVTTSECVYRVSLDWTVIDTADSKNVGISSMYIIKAADDINLSSAYNGDGKETPGINIGVQNTWPDNLTYFDE